MFEFIFKMFIRLLSVFTLVRFGKPPHPSYKEAIKFGTLNNQPIKARLTKCWKKLFFIQFAVSVKKGSGSCNMIDDPYVRLLVLNKVKNK